MNALELLNLVLPKDGWLVGWAKRGQERRQWASPTIEHLIETQQKYDRNGWDTYHACASFKAKLRVKMRGHANVFGLACLWLDIDTQESKPGAKYRDRQDAYEAVQAFCRAARLPPPIFVSSGGGLHCYWPLVEELLLETWTVYALALKKACVSLGLQADPVRTSDASSVLRTPETHHHGLGRLVECGEPAGPYPLELFEHLKGFANEPQPTPQPKLSSSPLARAAGAVYGNAPSDIEAVRNSCPQLGRFADNPDLSGEPVWYAVCGLAGYSGSDAVNWLNQFEYRGQPQRNTIAWNEAKIAQWKAQVKGPPTCREFDRVNPGICEKCPHWERITSPIILGRGFGAKQAISGHAPSLGTTQGEIELPELPAPWRWSNTGQLILPQEDNRGAPQPVIISDFPIYLGGVHATETAGLVNYAFRQHLPRHGWRTITVEAGTFFSARGMAELANGGAVIREFKLFTGYVHDALDAWHRANRMSDRYEQCGWKNQDKDFLVGDMLYTTAGSSTVTVNDELATRAQYLRPTPNGDVRKWTSTANQLFVSSMPAQTAVLASFAAPLMRYHTRHEGGCVLSLLNRRSGTGKTMALEGAISVWGDPLGLSMTSTDTQAAKGLIFAAAGNLPVMFDELASLTSKKRPEELKELIDVFSSGHDRRRALQHGEGLRHTSAQWQTILLTASNLSIVDQLEIYSKGVDAPGFRVWEVPADFLQRFDYASGDRLKAELFENAGHAGAAYLKYLLQPDVMDFTRKALEAAADEIWKTTGWKSQHRFWVRFLSALWVAGQHVRSLGLLQIDPEEVIRWNLAQAKHRTAPITGEGDDTEEERKERTDRDAIGVLDEFCRTHVRDTLVVSAAWNPRDRAVEPIRAPMGKLLLRSEVLTGRLFVPSKDFRAWVIREGYTYTEVVKTLTEGKILVNPKRLITLGAGTTWATAQTPCLEFDMQHPAVNLIARLVQEPKLEVVK